MWFGLMIGFIEHLQLVPANNFITFTNLHTLEITAASIKSTLVVCFVMVSENAAQDPSVIMTISDFQLGPDHFWPMAHN
jgi:hypothetical protein